MKKTSILVIAMATVLVLSSCANVSDNIQDQESTQPDSSVNQTGSLGRLVSLDDFDVALSLNTDAGTFLGSGSGLLPVEGCESGQNELFNSLGSEAISFFIPTNFEDDSRNNDTILTQERFEFSSPEDATTFVDVVQKSVADGCFYDGSYSDIVLHLEKLSSPEFLTPGISYYREQSQNPSYVCGEEIFVSRKQFWIQISDTFVFITQAEAIECGYEADTGPWLEVLRLGNMAASKVS
jgi:hypothetical protein